MVAGTASDVGKSVVATALCRVLAEEGFRVAPFKAQNMSNNAAVTADGGEIGRSQAAQAKAAGVEPTVDMNPILLKPEAEDRSQVVIRGRATGVRDARGYWSDRSRLWPVVTQSLDRLRKTYDVVVMEGAGSAAELNLRAGDLTNLRVARHAQAAVLLVGDIERGGIFAQLLGTLDLLEPDERRLVRGLIVNRFRGDISLFEDGRTILEERSGLPVLGVLPYHADLPVPPEDSQSTDAIASEPEGNVVSVAVIAYPRASNVDDAFPLRGTGARVSVVRHPAELGWPHLIVLPGSKATVDDLLWLRRSGLGVAVCRRSSAGVAVLGLCGGYQMLGVRVDDSVGSEGPPRIVEGLGLLPVETVLQHAKTTRRRTAVASGHSLLLPGGSELTGYEIHSGRTTALGPSDPFATLEPEGTADGAVSDDGLVAGTYLHGLLDRPGTLAELLAALATRAGVTRHVQPSPRSWSELSAWFRGAVDVERIVGWAAREPGRPA